MFLDYLSFVLIYVRVRSKLQWHIIETNITNIMFWYYYTIFLTPEPQTNRFLNRWVPATLPFFINITNIFNPISGVRLDYACRRHLPVTVSHCPQDNDSDRKERVEWSHWPAMARPESLIQLSLGWSSLNAVLPVSRKRFENCKPSERLYTWDITWDIWKNLYLGYLEISQLSGISRDFRYGEMSCRYLKISQIDRTVFWLIFRCLLRCLYK